MEREEREVKLNCLENALVCGKDTFNCISLSAMFLICLPLNIFCICNTCKTCMEQTGEAIKQHEDLVEKIKKEKRENLELGVINKQPKRTEEMINCNQVIQRPEAAHYS